MTGAWNYLVSGFKHWVIFPPCNLQQVLKKDSKFIIWFYWRGHAKFITMWWFMPWIWWRWCLFDSKLVQTHFATITKQKSNEKVLRINSFKKNNFSFTENDYGREFKVLMKWFIYLMDLSILCLIYEIMWPLRRIISFLMLYQVVIDIFLCAKLITEWTECYFCCRIGQVFGFRRNCSMASSMVQSSLEEIVL